MSRSITYGPDGQVIEDTTTEVPHHQRPLMVDVRLFGAVGDGEVDDTAAIHAARDASGEGGVVVVPTGMRCLHRGLFATVEGQTWQIDGVLVHDETETARNSIRVQADGVTICGGLFVGGPHSGVFIEADDCTVRGATFDGPGGAGVRSTGNGAARPIVDGCRITGSGDHAIHLNAEAVGARVTGCVIRGGAKNGVWIGKDSTAVLVDGNDIADMGRMGVEVWNGCPRSVIANNRVTDTGHFGISLDHSPSSTVTGNTVARTTGYGIECASSPMTTVTGNAVSEAGSAGIAVTGNDTSWSDGAVINANTVDSSGGNGILVSGTVGDTKAEGISITGNSIHDPGDIAIRLNADVCRQVTVANNRIRFDETCHPALTRPDGGLVCVGNSVWYSPDLDGQATAFNLAGLTDSLIASNHLDGGGKVTTGISLSTVAAGVLIEGNWIVGTTANAMLIQADRASVVVAHNRCVPTSGLGINAAQGVTIGQNFGV